MARTAIGLAIGIAFVTAVIWSALSASDAQCEICVEFKGRTACSVAAAENLAQAEAQAHSGACSQVTGGVTETLDCAAVPASVRNCSE
jgi:hypothetical protein